MPARRRDTSSDPFAAVGCTDVVPIGSGGTSIVYRAYQPAFDRLIALKVLVAPLADERSRRRFAREVALAGRLTGHPNVVTVFASGFLADGRGYVEMEYCPGGSLMDRVAQQGPMPVRDVCSIGVKLAGVLELARQGGIVHRDVKPANVLVTRFGEPALSDFGIATVAGEITGTTRALTPVHAAPEVLESREVGPPADQWSLASTLYTLLAGRPPFGGSDRDGMLAGMLRILSDPVPAIPRADIPDGLWGALQRAMAKAPDGRWPTPAAFGEELQAVERASGWGVTVLPVEEVAEQRYGSFSGDITPAEDITPVAPPEGSATQAWQRRGAHPVESSVSPPTHPEEAPAPPAELPGGPVSGDLTRQWSRRSTSLEPPMLPEAPPSKSHRRLWVVLGGVAAVVVAAVVAVVVASSGGGGHRVPGTTVIPGNVNQANQYAPENLYVAAEQPTSVTLRWTDPNNGRFPFVVRVNGGPAHTTTGPTQTVVAVTAGRPYCFEVGAVYAVGGVSYAPPKCINGGQPAPAGS
ncbi:MAG: protein kinase [Acidimicrobiaceae bacterium]|nr:protein kinase [Acidimicrobiaceae bacterium]